MYIFSVMFWDKHVIDKLDTLTADLLSLCE